MLQRSLLLALVLCQLALFGAGARADDVVECDKSRDTCDAKILELCPAGAEVLDEQELTGSAGPRYRMTFRCRGGQAGATAAPAPMPAPAAPPPTGPGPSFGGDPVALQLELRTVEARLADLKAERKRHSLVGPIILTSVGFGAALVFAVTALSAASDSGCDDYDDWDDDDLDFDSCDTVDDVNEGLVVTSSVLSVIGAGVGVGGLIWLLRRSKARKANDPEIEQLKLRQEQLRMQGVSYSFAVDPVGGRLILRGRF